MTCRFPLRSSDLFSISGHFGDLRSEHAQLFHEAHGAMRSLMWHKNQKSVCAMILAIVNEAQT